ncbi:hypothetical protein [Dokdonella soli]|uniref:Uncharacterized protein n=1 Tax=Dokdonella soli TaxID=529810 RepID=A0ABN1IMU9_9GAMM
MAIKPNYKFDKRQRDLAKKKQQDEKRLKKQSKTEVKGTGDAGPTAPAQTSGGPEAENAGP